jgi:uncharacterized protein (TIGR02118 family)
MIVRVGVAPRAIGLSCPEFQAHWRGEHGGLAGEIAGVRGYVQNHAVLAHDRPLLAWPGFDACAEIEFESVAAMDEGFSSEHYRSAVVADEQVMIDKTRFSLLLAQRRVLRDSETSEDAVKLLTVLTPAPGTSVEALAARLAGDYPEALGGVPFQRHEQLLEAPGAHTGRQPAFCAAIDLLWFERAEHALAFVNGADGDRARLALTGVVAGTERLIAQPVRIV